MTCSAPRCLQQVNVKKEQQQKTTCTLSVPKTSGDLSVYRIGEKIRLDMRMREGNHGFLFHLFMFFFQLVLTPSCYSGRKKFKNV